MGRLVEEGVHRGVRLLPECGGALHHVGGEARSVEPGVGRRELIVGERVEQMAVDVGHAEVETPSHERQETGLVRGQVHVGDAEDEGLVALVAAAFEQVCRLRVGAGHDDPRNAHDIELEPRRVEALDLLVGGHEHLAALVAALLGARTLVLDVVPGDARLGEAANEVAYVRISAVARVRIGDEERPVVHLRCLGPLLVGHLAAQELLVAVGGEQGAHDAGSLVRDLAQGVAGEVGARVLGGRALGRGGPSAHVDPLDAHALDGHRLARRVGSEGGDAPALLEQLAQAIVERDGGLARHGVVARDGPALLHHLPRRVQARDALEPRAVEPLLGGHHGLVECVHGPSGASFKSPGSR